MDISKISHKIYNYDLFVLYDDNDEHASKTVLPALTTESIPYCSLQDHGMPGQLILDTVLDHSARSRRVLCIIPENVCANKDFNHLLTILCDDANVIVKIITLTNDGKMPFKNDMSRLRNVPSINISKYNWITDLKNELLTIIPEYCLQHLNRGTSNSVFFKGLLLQHMGIDLYGVLITAKNKNFLIDFPEFCKHIDKHTALQVAHACESCGFLYDVNSTVSLAFSDDFFDDEFLKLHETKFVNGMLELIQCVIDAQNPRSKRNPWSLLCSVSGQYSPRHAHFIKNIFGCLIYALLNKAASKMKAPFLKEYEDPEKRKENLKIIVKDEKKLNSLANAGFVFIANPDRVQCFYCAWHIPMSVIDLDPVLYHASYMPLCPYIQGKVSKDSLPPKRFHHKKSNESNIVTTNTGNSYVDFQNCAEAGFYKNGFKDVIECINCGLCIVVNNTNTNLWVTHALLSPTCEFVLAKRGEEFVQSVNAQRAIDKDPTIVTFALKDFSYNHRDDWPGILFTPDTI